MSYLFRYLCIVCILKNNDGEGVFFSERTFPHSNFAHTGSHSDLSSPSCFRPFFKAHLHALALCWLFFHLEELIVSLTSMES